MKKNLLSFLACITVTSVFAQLQVSTTTQKRKVILEEYTGIHCQYCPDGHKRADQYVAANPGNAFVINVHAGSYSNPASGEPDFRTAYGTPLAGQTGLTGYPAGTVNRHIFSGLSQGSGTAMGRGNWGTAGDQIKSQNSYVNVALQGNIDPATRVLTVEVEVYYTGNSTQATNYLNVVLIQDSVLGPQTSGSTYYPAMMVGSQYQHNKILRYMLSGQWGDQIATTTQGYKFTKQYTYTIPAQLPATVSGGAIKTNVLLSKLRVVAFVTETQQEIVSGNSGPITIGTSTGMYDVSQEYDFSVYPNPSAGSSTIALALNKEENVKVKVYNLIGTEVYSYESTMTSGPHYLQLDGSGLSGGLYFIKVFVGDQVQTEKLILEK